MPLAVALLVFVAAAVALFAVAASRWRPVYARWSDVVLLGLGIAAAVNAVRSWCSRLTQRRALAPLLARAAAEAERWAAFRRYLTDFPRLQDAPPATLALWERYLVYGIAFGIAERVLQAAHLAMPEEMAQASTIYWISPGGQPRLRARPRLRSATSPPGSARRSRLRPPAPGAEAAASRAEAAAAAAAAAAAPGEVAKPSPLCRAAAGETPEGAGPAGLPGR